MSDRQVRYRQRRKAGRRVYTVEAYDADVDVLLDAGYSLAQVIELCAFVTRNAGSNAVRFQGVEFTNGRRGERRAEACM